MLSSVRFQRHTGFTFVLVTLISSVVIFSLSAFFLSLRYSAMVFYKKIFFWDIPSLCLIFFPRLTLLSASVGFIAGLSWYYTTLFRRGHYTAMSSFGVSPLFFVWPTLAVSFGISSLLSFLSLSFFPSLVSYGKSREFELHSRVDASFFAPEILFGLGKSYFYAHTKKRNGSFEGVFFLDRRDSSQESALFGGTASVQSVNGGMYTLLNDGQGVFLSSESGPTFSSFKEYTSYFPLGQDKKTRKRRSFAQEKKSVDLWGGCDEDLGELCRRVTLPFFPLLTSLLFGCVIMNFGHQFLWCAILGAVALCGVVWSSASSLLVFSFLFFSLIAFWFFLGGGRKI